MNIVLLCGGKGTRVSSISNGKAKALLKIGDTPFIFLLLDSLRKNLIKRVFFLVSYGSEEIKCTVGNNYKGIDIEYINDDNKNNKSGTAAALSNAIAKLPDDFLIQYGDTILDLNYADFFLNLQKNPNLLHMSIYKNENFLDKSNVIFEDDKLIYLNSEEINNNKSFNSAKYIDYGLLGVKKSLLKKYAFILNSKPSLKHFQSELSNLNLIKPYLVHKPFHEIGTVKSYYEFINNFKMGKLNNVIYT